MIDGASRARQFFSVTVPMLRPTIIFVVNTSTIGGLQIFDEPRILAGVTLATIPLIIVFTLAGKQLVSGIMQGAVKG